ncbi:hypothetical protein TresaDRAFT_1751 [Treponema saccharophilum DSM 2985]|uniref:Uncharacterized protein n=1 Tax=Treponema saccharophilum DSM 2985 TaxID=907348 RepID=H7EKB2_9SPIR|nr:hypothetical protein TresaDRAFT_1751 [Treponema saccharophilum DSM 2985]
MRLRVFFRSKFGFIGASVRRCAEAHLPCPGGRLRGFFCSKFGLVGESGRRRAEARLPCPGGRLRGFFFCSKFGLVGESAPSVPGRAVAGIFFAPSSASSEQAGAGAQKRAFRAREGGCEDFFSLQVRLGRRKGRRCAEARLPCMGGRLRGFFFAPSSAWSEQACAGAQKRAFRARAGGCGAVFRYTACTEGFVIPNLIRNICLRMHG